MGTTPQGQSSSSGKAGPSFFEKNKIWFIVGALFVVTNAGIFFYQKWQYNKLAERYKQELVLKGQMSRKFVNEQNKVLGTALARTVVWGIRGEMMRGNIELIDQYLIGLVQETGLDLIAVEDSSGKIILSTDKKYENQQISAILPAVPSNVTEPMFVKSDPEEIIMVSPIMAADRRLGTFFMKYKPGERTAEFLQKIRTDNITGGGK